MSWSLNLMNWMKQIIETYLIKMCNDYRNFSIHHLTSHISNLRPFLRHLNLCANWQWQRGKNHFSKLGISKNSDYLISTSVLVRSSLCSMVALQCGLPLRDGNHLATLSGGWGWVEGDKNAQCTGSGNNIKVCCM